MAAARRSRLVDDEAEEEGWRLTRVRMRAWKVLSHAANTKTKAGSNWGVSAERRVRRGASPERCYGRCKFSFRLFLLHGRPSVDFDGCPTRLRIFTRQHASRARKNCSRVTLTFTHFSRGGAFLSATSPTTVHPSPNCPQSLLRRHSPLDSICKPEPRSNFAFTLLISLCQRS